MRELLSADLFVYYALHSGMNILILEDRDVEECEFINNVLNKKKPKKNLIKVSNDDCLTDSITEDEFLSAEIKEKSLIISNRVSYKTLKKVIDEQRNGNQFVAVIEGKSQVISLGEIVSNLSSLEAVNGDIRYSNEVNKQIDLIVKISEDSSLSSVIDNVMYTHVDKDTHKVELIEAIKYNSCAECYELSEDTRLGFINRIFIGLTPAMKNEFEILVNASLAPWASKPYSEEINKYSRNILELLIPDINEFDTPNILVTGSSGSRVYNIRNRIFKEHADQVWKNSVQLIDEFSACDAIEMESAKNIDPNIRYMATAKYKSLDSFLYRLSDRIYEFKVGEIPEDGKAYGYSAYGKEVRELFDIVIVLNDNLPAEVYKVGHADNGYRDFKKICRDVTLEMEYDK